MVIVQFVKLLDHLQELKNKEVKIMPYRAYWKQKYHKKWDKSPIYKTKKEAKEYLKVAMSRQDVHERPYIPSYMQGFVRKVKK